MSDICTHGHPHGTGYPCTACLEEEIRCLNLQKEAKEQKLHRICQLIEAVPCICRQLPTFQQCKRCRIIELLAGEPGSSFTRKGDWPDVYDHCPRCDKTKLKSDVCNCPEKRHDDIIDAKCSKCGKPYSQAALCFECQEA